ncbi:MAG: serine/threonine protein kinase [Labilithrix sp.]|nr:serine/threonine protein kinase [Labilithrix sp.]
MSNVDPAPSSRRLVATEPLVVGRYELSAELARGGMATVYVGRLHGDGGFKRVVAIKRLHAQFRTDDNLSTMFLDEARLAARIRHPNVVHAVDVALHDGEMFIVMEYVEGASLSQLMRGAGRRSEQIPFAVICAIVSGLLQGLHAAHEAVDEQGQPLGIVHRDVSPQNVLVGTDGVARVLDFGVAKAIGQAHVTREGEVKGKLAYMAPEQLLGAHIERQADVFAAGTILWELLTGRRLFYGSNDGEIVRRLLELPIPPPCTINTGLTPAVDDVVLRALERDPARRFASAAEMAAALEDAILPATSRQVSEWVRALESESLAARAALVAEIESDAGASSRRAANPQPAATVKAPRPTARTAAALIVLGGVTLFGVGWGASRIAGRAPENRAMATEGGPAITDVKSGAVVAEAQPPPTPKEVGSSSPSVAPASSVTFAAASSSSSTTPSAPPPSANRAVSRGKALARPSGAAAASGTKAPIYSRD